VELAIVTSRLQWGADWSAEILGIESYFTAILGVEATEKHKPNPEPALLALEKLGVKAEDAAFIGDAAVDIACGKAADMKTIGVGWGVLGDKLKDAEPDYFVPTVNALSHLLLLDEEL
jgi:pyrophosphatase PpaX